MCDLHHYDVTAGLIFQKNQFLITQRTEDDRFSGLWEFPGGKQKEDETLEQCLIREIFEELNFHIKIEQYLFDVTHIYDHMQITLHIFLCSKKSGQPQCKEVQSFQWIIFDELKNYEFTIADRKVIEQLTSLKNSGKLSI